MHSGASPVHRMLQSGAGVAAPHCNWRSPQVLSLHTHYARTGRSEPRDCIFVHLLRMPCSLPWPGGGESRGLWPGPYTRPRGGWPTALDSPWRATSRSASALLSDQIRCYHVHKMQQHLPRDEGGLGYHTFVSSMATRHPWLISTGPRTCAC